MSFFCLDRSTNLTSITMADITKRNPGCDDDCNGERGKRGKRGKRGHRGHDGRDGHTAHFVLDGTTPGDGSDESVELKNSLRLVDGRAYTITYTAVAAGTQAGAPVSRGFEGSFNVRRDGGISTITNTGVGQAYGDPSTNDWTLEADATSGSGDRVILTFTTGAIPTATRVVATVNVVEAAR